MKKLLAVATVSLIVLGLGNDRASAFGCCKFFCKMPAAQYNAFSPFCCNAVVGPGRCGLCCRKCSYVADCCPQPCCPPPCCPPPCCPDPCAGLGMTSMPAPTVAPPAAQPHSMMPMAPGMNAMIQPTGYNTAYQPNYAYLQMLQQQQLWQQYLQQMQQMQQMQMQQVMQGQAALTNNGMAPLNNGPYYWNPAAQQAGQQ